MARAPARALMPSPFTLFRFETVITRYFRFQNLGALVEGTSDKTNIGNKFQGLLDPKDFAIFTLFFLSSFCQIKNNFIVLKYRFPSKSNLLTNARTRPLFSNALQCSNAGYDDLRTEFVRSHSK